MPMRRAIGFSLALMMLSAGAIAEESEKHPSQQPGQGHGARPGKLETRSGKSRFAFCGAAQARSHRRAKNGYAGPQPADSSSDASSGAAQTPGRSEYGNAAWYDWVGNRTASGEVLDAVTATAAHRTLPLSSYARVTNLDNGRSVIVRINDRGPRSHRFIIDLSPRAANAIDVVRTGVAAVVVEPVAAATVSSDQPTPTAGAFQTANAAVDQ